MFGKMNALVVTLMLAVASSSFAGQISYTASVPLQPTDFFLEVPAPPIPLYNGAQPLTQVLVEVEGVLQGDASVTNNETVAQIINNFDLTGTVLLNGPASLSITALPLLDVVGGLFGPAPFVMLANNANPIVVPTTQVTDTASDTAVGGTGNFGLADFTGVGFVNFTVTAFGTSAFDGSSNLIVDFNTDAAANITVTYTFQDDPSDVPEPMTAGLLAVGSLVLVRRRR